ncbi:MULTISPECIES: hypothetical protein [unclassified Mesorhizobium]|uniref:hypothetical protein n=1 Tax=unclassified Mesorhizobium TaxID=325217 RepID=UPI0011281DEB|nr:MULTISPECIES: hypothetical protein [unclassified Mesorhizobium]MBZ9897823.1 hypothetical protein [Mesorhizobium sp. BR1-1-6]MCA0060318.1 hypothetical protein [Mesorhizobium sp. B261B1A]TPK68341.1 hypothetical protein FJ551_01005 [Mesorhizobium sp. B2-5-1]TPL10505.1 hypothetical protein FJ944_12820 [Mesorhizobium sp. B2-4-11]TPL21506.1 hypothetical protein FJ952_07110 [Mesorhizobium sp. B2-4-10]
MSDIHTDALPCPDQDAARLGIADWLGLAAAPTFALMALLAGIFGGDAAMLCMGTSSPLTGMPAMYLLMSAFHLAPWLRVISNRQAGREKAKRLEKTLQKQSIAQPV